METFLEQLYVVLGQRGLKITQIQGLWVVELPEDLSTIKQGKFKVPLSMGHHVPMRLEVVTDRAFIISSPITNMIAQDRFPGTIQQGLGVLAPPCEQVAVWLEGADKPFAKILRTENHSVATFEVARDILGTDGHTISVRMWKEKIGEVTKLQIRNRKIPFVGEAVTSDFHFMLKGKKWKQTGVQLYDGKRIPANNGRCSNFHALNEQNNLFYDKGRAVARLRTYAQRHVNVGFKDWFVSSVKTGGMFAKKCFVQKVQERLEDFLGDIPSLQGDEEHHKTRVKAPLCPFGSHCDVHITRRNGGECISMITSGFQLRAFRRDGVLTEDKGLEAALTCQWASETHSDFSFSFKAFYENGIPTKHRDFTTYCGVVRGNQVVERHGRVFKRTDAGKLVLHGERAWGMWDNYEEPTYGDFENGKPVKLVTPRFEVLYQGEKIHADGRPAITPKDPLDLRHTQFWVAGAQRPFQDRMQWEWFWKDKRQLLTAEATEDQRKELLEQLLEALKCERRNLEPDTEQYFSPVLGRVVGYDEVWDLLLDGRPFLTFRPFVGGPDYHLRRDATLIRGDKQLAPPPYIPRSDAKQHDVSMSLQSARKITPPLYDLSHLQDAPKVGAIKGAAVMEVIRGLLPATTSSTGDHILALAAPLVLHKLFEGRGDVAPLMAAAFESELTRIGTGPLQETVKEVFTALGPNTMKMITEKSHA